MRSDATLVRTSRSFLVPRRCVRSIFEKRIFASPVHEVFSDGKLKSERTHPERPKQGFTSGLWQMPSPASFLAFPNLHQRKPGVLLANGFLNRLRHQPTNQSSKVTRQVMMRPSPPKASGFLHNISAEEQLAFQVAELKDRVLELENERNALLAHVILEDNGLLQFYTGFSSKDMFMACFDFLKDSAESMRTGQGSRTKLDGKRRGQKPGPERKMSLINQFFFVCVRLRRGLPLEDLADRFKVSATALSRLFITWVNLMYVKFDELLVWPSRRRVDRNMPKCFKTSYPSTRIIIDCTEFYIQRPSSLATQSASFSSYKNANTCKLL